MGTAELDGLAWVGATLDRIAELEVELGEHTAGRRGSGCRVTSGAVLTAARVVAGAIAIQVRLNPGTPDEWATPGTVAFADDDADVAVVSIAPRQPGERVAAALFGRINTQADGIRCAVGGFPAGIVEGRIPALSSWRNGTLDLEVSPPSEVPGGTRSPWAGIAGAAVWCRGHIVGVVSDHDRGNGLAAGRVDHWFEQVPPAQLASLRKLVGLPDAASQLTDVTDLGDAEAALDPAGLAAALAPLDLLDRGAELADLADFCAGNTAYQWWRADPWAGKTALAAWLVLHPPAGMTPVAFFAGCHEPGRARSEAFTEALIRQFAAIVGEPPDLVAPAAVHTQYRRLLAEATRVLAATGRRLLLVVDGLDEDDGGPPTDPRSIASRLPQHPSDGMRILVTSRWRPGVPGDVPRGHPLRTCTVRELSPSPHARHLTVRARRELAQALVDGDQLRADVLGLIAAAGGRLTPRDLVELTGADRDRLAALLDGAFGRTLATHPAEGSSHPAGPAFGFAHDALRETAEAEVSALRPRYVERLDRWADSYRERGWPASTPRYLLRPYTRMLARTGNQARLAVWSADRARHDLMREQTFSDGDGLAEVSDAQRLAATCEPPNLAGLALLAIERARLTTRHRTPPVTLPAIWARLGDPHRARALADSMDDPAARAAALTGLISALAAAGEAEFASQAVSAARRAVGHVTSEDAQAVALARLAATAATAGLLAEAERILAELGPSLSAATRKFDVEKAVALVAAGRTQDALDLAAAICGPRRRPRLEELQARPLLPSPPGLPRFDAADQQVDPAWGERPEQGPTLTQAERADRFARRLRHRIGAAAWPEETPSSGAVRSIRDMVKFHYAPPDSGIPYGKDGKPIVPPGALRRSHDADPGNDLGRLAGALATAGQADAALRVARHGPASEAHGQPSSAALSDVAIGLALAGELGQAEEIARSISSAKPRVRALAQIAASYDEAGQHEAAARVAAESEQVAREITKPGRRAAVLAVAATGLAAAGEPDRAARAALDAAAAAAPAAAAATTTGAVKQARILGQAAVSLVMAGQFDRAEHAVQTITDPVLRAVGLAGLADALASAGQEEHAKRAALSAERPDLAGTSPRQAGQLGDLAVLLAGSGELAAAERIVRSIADPGTQAAVLAETIGVLLDIGCWSDARRLARYTTARHRRNRQLAEILRDRRLRRRDAPHQRESLASAPDLRWLLGAYPQLNPGFRRASDELIRNPRVPVRRPAVPTVAVRSPGEPLSREAVAMGRHMEVQRSPWSTDLESRALVGADLAAKNQLALARQVALGAEHSIQYLPTPAVWALALLFGTLLTAGDPAGAERLARAAPPSYYLMAAAELAGALLTAGELTDAERIVVAAERSAHGPVSAADAKTLLRMAEYCRHAPDLMPVVRRLCAMVLTSDSWLMAVPLMCRLDADGIDRAAGRTELPLAPATRS